MMKKRGQQGPSGMWAGLLIGVVALLIVMYILFLPPDARNELLEGQGSIYNPGSYSTTTPAGSYVTANKTLFEEKPGTIFYYGKTDVDHDIPSFSLLRQQGQQVLGQINTFYVKNGWFDKQFKSYTFNINDLSNTANVILTFQIKDRARGMLIVSLNGNTIYQNAITGPNVDPIPLPQNMLRDSNELTFEVSGVGGLFWVTNEYTIDKAQIIAQVTDTSKEQSKNTFYLEQDEYQNIDRAILKFFPDCNINEVGRLTIVINREVISTTVPDCGVLNLKEFSPDILYSGRNDIIFTTEQGSYLMDRITVQTKLKEQRDVTYYFELDKNLFDNVVEDTDTRQERCGDIDGFCPSDCDSDTDKDCCFQDNNDAFWCDAPTIDVDERCVNVIDDLAKCGRCQSGYEDEDGDPAETCQDLCGDDEDNYCPAGCSRLYDADCCYEGASSSNPRFFCYDIPTTGIQSACLQSISTAQCLTCPDEYRSDRGSIATPCRDVTRDTNDITRLKSRYDVKLEIDFVDDTERKQASLYLNGHLINIDTTDDKWSRRVDEFVVDGNNGIKIVPKSTLDMVSIRFVLEENTVR